MKKTLFAIPMILSGVLAMSSEASALGYTNNDYCREYTRTIYVGGQAQQGYGTACQQPDGSWKIISGDGVGQSIAPSYIIEQPVVYYQEPPRNVYRTTRYYAPRDSYTSLSISFGDNDGWRDRKHRGRDWHGRGHGHRDHDRGHTRRSGSRISWR